MRQAEGLPELIVSVGRGRQSPAELAAIASVKVTCALAHPTQCVITWRLDSAGASIDIAPGDALRVEVGAHREPLFTGEVTVVEHVYGADRSREFRVRAYDALHRLRKRQFTRLHEPQTIEALTRVLTEGTGMDVTGGGVSLGPFYQCARSDLDVLVEVSARVGLYPVVAGTSLHLVDLRGEGDPLDLELGGNLHSVDVEVSQEPSFRSADVTGWFPATATEITASVSGSPARAEVRADAAPQSVGGGGAMLRQNDPLGSIDEATALAQAELDVRAAGEVTVSLVTDGDPRIRPGRRLRVIGIASLFEGSYTACSVVHTIDGRGFESAVSTSPPKAPAIRHADVTTLGVVTDDVDPEGRGRVRVDLPAFAGLTSGWAPVVVAAAGAGKGATFLPAPADTVLVLLSAADPANAIIIGGLYGVESIPGDGNRGSPGERFVMRTRDGQQLTFNGAEHTVRITDGHGSSIDLGPDVVRLTAATDLVIEAPGRAMRIRAQTVDFEEAL